MVIEILDYLISHQRHRWPNLDTINGGQGGQGAQGHARDVKPK